MSETASNPSPPPSELPPISARELSWHEAQAGIAAREAAKASGGDAAQLRALAQAASAEAPEAKTVTVGNPNAASLNGRPLRGDDLLVSLCLMLYEQVFGEDARRPIMRAKPGGDIRSLEAFASLGLIFADTETAYDLLDRAADEQLSPEDRAGWARDFRRSAASFSGKFATREIEILGAHVVRLSRLAGPADSGEDAPGK